MQSERHTHTVIAAQYAPLSWLRSEAWWMQLRLTMKVWMNCFIFENKTPISETRLHFFFWQFPCLVVPFTSPQCSIIPITPPKFPCSLVSLTNPLKCCNFVPWGSLLPHCPLVHFNTVASTLSVPIDLIDPLLCYAGYLSSCGSKPITALRFN